MIVKTVQTVFQTQIIGIKISLVVQAVKTVNPALPDFQSLFDKQPAFRNHPAGKILKRGNNAVAVAIDVHMIGIH